MRLLKVLAILMVVIVLAAVGLVVYFFSTANVTVMATSSSGMLATENQARFDELKQAVATGTLIGTRFDSGQGELGEAADYAFITYTARISNQCLFPIDMVEIQVVPETGDVLQIGTQQAYSLGARSIGDIQTTILTGRDSHAIRELVITYYIWGRPFTISRTAGAK